VATGPDFFPDLRLHLWDFSSSISFPPFLTGLSRVYGLFSPHLRCFVCFTGACVSFGFDFSAPLAPPLVDFPRPLARHLLFLCFRVTGGVLCGMGEATSLLGFLLSAPQDVSQAPVALLRRLIPKKDSGPPAGFPPSSPSVMPGLLPPGSQPPPGLPHPVTTPDVHLLPDVGQLLGAGLRRDSGLGQPSSTFVGSPVVRYRPEGPEGIHMRGSTVNRTEILSMERTLGLSPMRGVAVSDDGVGLAMTSQEREYSNPPKYKTSGHQRTRHSERTHSKDDNFRLPSGVTGGYIDQLKATDIVRPVPRRKSLTTGPSDRGLGEVSVRVPPYQLGPPAPGFPGAEGSEPGIFEAHYPDNLPGSDYDSYSEEETKADNAPSNTASAMKKSVLATMARVRPG